MRKDFKALPWLTPEQAVTALREMTKTDLTFDDLITHCQYYNCEAFISASGLQGTTTIPFPVGEDDWSYTCFAHGPQRVINAEVLTGSKGMTKLYLQGTVREKNEEESPCADYIEWEAEADPAAFPVQFRSDDINNLAVAINGPAKDLDARARNSLYRIISVLLAMTELDKLPPTTAFKKIEKASSLYGIELALKPEAGANHIKAAFENIP